MEDGMCGVTPEIRELIVKARRNGKKVMDIAEMFDVSRKTVWKWCKRISKKGWPNYRDRSRKPHRIHRKITPNVEEAILVLRESFNWGTQRMMVALLSPPPHIQYLLETVIGEEWKFFRAKDPNEMWQIDIKGPFLIDGKRLNALLVLDDYSRFLVSVQLFKSITTDVVTQALDHCISTYNSPSKILADNGPQFRDTFEKWCNESKRGIDVVHAPPFYPQCKGKIERCIRNFNKEYIRLDKVFEDASSLVGEYQEWYNNERYNSGVHDIPVNLYLSENVTNLT